MLTIVHIINGLESGGAETTMFGLCTNDTANRHIVISLLDQGKYFQPLVELGIAVHCIDLKGKGWFLQKIWRLYKLLRQLQPDVVQTWMYHSDLIGGVVARLAGVKKVFWGVHNTVLTPELSKRSTIIISRLCSWLSGVIPHQIICCAEKALAVHADLGYDKQKLCVVNNGYDLTKFMPNPAEGALLRQQLGLDADTLLLGCVGRFDPNKDHKNLLDALTLLAKQGLAFRCCLVGNQMTRDNEQLWSWIVERGLTEHLILLGLRNDIPALMNAFDLHVLASLAEAFPNVLCEAMACTTPCVTTDVGDAAIIVADTGWVVPPGDALQLATAIQSAVEAMDDAAAWQMRRDAARTRIVEQFSISKMVSGYKHHWQAGS
ncbi:MAG: glycosyltransferase family 4 protein [Alishewanella aestuarii]